MELHNLTKTTDNTKKRVGRGFGSGKGGHTVGKGSKGQKSRKGSKFTPGFEGGQVPLYKRLPQMGGFKSHTGKKIIALSMAVLNKFDEETVVTPQMLVDTKIIKMIPRDGVKILNTGKLEKKLTLIGFLFSESAKKKIEKSGSKINE